MLMLREDQFDARVSIDGSPIFGSWASISGGALTAQVAKTRTGGGGREVSLGGPGQRSDLTLTIQTSDVVMARHNYLESTVGRKRFSCSVTILDENYAPIGGLTFTRVGTVGGWELGNLDANAGQNTSFCTLVLNCDEQAA